MTTLDGLFDDPYLAWSVLTGFGGSVVTAGIGERAPVPLLLELRSAADIEDLGKHVKMPSIYSELVRGDNRFVTAVARQCDLPRVQQLVRGMQMAMPVDALAAAIDAGASESTAPDISPITEQLVFAVIDRDCAFLNESFRDPDNPNSTRLLGLWQQGVPAAGDRWKSPPGLDYGRELTRTTIDALIARAKEEDEEAVYQQLQYLLDERGRRVRETSHGTAVLDAGAGRVTAPAVRNGAKPDRKDGAERVPLIFVDIAEMGLHDTTGASSSAFLLDALAYIRMRAGTGANVVVNISVGALAGPHDGSSMTERAIDAFVNADGHMAIMVAGGNAALENWHARGTLGQDARVIWRQRPDDVTDSFVEVWFENEPDARPQLRLTAPNGDSTGWIGFEQGAATLPARAAPEAIAAAVFMRRAGIVGRNAMALIATAPCAGKRALAPHGNWTIELRSASGSSCAFDAWVQRDQPTRDGQTPIQSDFVAAYGSAFIDAAGSLSDLATGHTTISVGAVDAQTRRPARYTSRGTGRSSGGQRIEDIDLVAVADESPTIVGLIATGVKSRSQFRQGGSSMAAPIAARQLLNHLHGSKVEKGLATQAREWAASRQPLLGAMTDHGTDAPISVGRPPALTAA